MCQKIIAGIANAYNVSKATYIFVRYNITIITCSIICMYVVYLIILYYDSYREKVL